MMRDDLALAVAFAGGILVVPILVGLWVLWVGQAHRPNRRLSTVEWVVRRGLLWRVK